MAFWELVLISKGFDARRKTIFTDIERPNGSSWSQILTICLEEFAAIGNRITAYTQNPLPTNPSEAAPQLYTETAVDKPPAKADNLYAVARRDPSLVGRTEATVGKLARSVGQSPAASIPPVKLLQYGVKKVLSEDQVANLQEDQIRKASGFVSDLFKTKLAAPFRESFERRATAVICGSPTSGASIIIDAIESISNLAVKSIEEDQPGQVQKDLANLVKAMVESILAIEKFVGTTLTPHWTDVAFTAADRKKVKDVNEVVDTLKSGVRSILDAFEGYLDDISITKRDAKLWRALTEKKADNGRPVTPVR
jgi:nucleoporin NDC1